MPRYSKRIGCAAVTLIGFRSKGSALRFLCMGIAAVDDEFHPALKSGKKLSAMGCEQRTLLISADQFFKRHTPGLHAMNEFLKLRPGLFKRKSPDFFWYFHKYHNAFISNRPAVSETALRPGKQQSLSFFPVRFRSIRRSPQVRKRCSCTEPPVRRHLWSGCQWQM